jgi:hypothetical protein
MRSSVCTATWLLLEVLRIAVADIGNIFGTCAAIDTESFLLHSLFALLLYCCTRCCHHPTQQQYLQVLEGHGLRPQALSLQATLTSAAEARHSNSRNPDEDVAFELQQALQRLVEGSGDKDLLLKGVS